MHADAVSWNLLDDLCDDAFNLVRQRAAIGVAEHDPARASRMRCPRAGQRVVGVRLEAVEEMLAIDRDFLTARDGGVYGLRNACKIVLFRGA